jgi:dihydrofolate reductase
VVLLDATISLDGFMAGPNDEVDWVLAYKEPSEAARQVIDTTGAFIAGRRSYDASLRAGGEIYGGAWSGAVFVVTHDPPDEPDPKVAFKMSVRDAVEAGIEAAAGRNVVVTGGEISRQALDMGLVDEIQLHVAPVLLGIPPAVRHAAHPARHARNTRCGGRRVHRHALRVVK